MWLKLRDFSSQFTQSCYSNRSRRQDNNRLTVFFVAWSRNLTESDEGMKEGQTHTESLGSGELCKP